MEQAGKKSALRAKKWIKDARLSDIILGKMRFNLALALSLSILLVGGASWSRFAQSQKAETNLQLVKAEQKASEEYYESVLAPLLAESASTTPSSAGPLTGTDLISRQLITDYVTLATEGGANDSNINILADRYIESIPTLISQEMVAYADIRVVSNNQSSLKKYSEELVRIQREYAQEASLLKPQPLIGGLSEDYYEYASSMAATYRKVATSLASVNVPTILAQDHIELVNTYFANATAMEAISKIAKDPATGFAGMVLLGESIGKEQAFLEKIGKVLTSNGV